MTTRTTGGRNARFWLEECEVALRHALVACEAARKNAEERSDLGSALCELDHHVGVARGTADAAMRADGMTVGARR